MTLAMAESIAEARPKSGVIWRKEPFILEDPLVARVLAKTKNELRLGGLRRLSPEVAKELSQHGVEDPPRLLMLSGLTDLSPQAALEISHHKLLDFPKLNPSLEALAALRQQHGQLSLGALNDITVPQAALLAQYRGSLVLEGITVLSEEVAICLAQSHGSLKLPNLEQLTYKSELSFAQGSVVLDVPNLRQINCPKLIGRILTNPNSPGATINLPNLEHTTIDCLKTMSDFNLPITLGLVNLTPEHAKALKHHQRNISLPRITELSEETIEAFAPEDFSGRLTLSHLNRLDSISLAKLILPKHTPKKSMGKSNNESPDQASMKNVFYEPIDLTLSVLEEPNAQVLAMLAKEPFSIRFSRLEKISIAMANAFELHTEMLQLPAVARVTDEVAKSLARHPGPLSMFGLEELSSIELANKLADVSEKTRVNFPKIRSISPVIANALIKTKGTVSLSGLESISDETREILKKNRRVYFKVVQ
jgi:hypothetical protein